MRVMNNCLFVDASARALGQILARADEVGGRLSSNPVGWNETIRIDFEDLPSREVLEGICAGAVRAASLVDAGLEWLVGEPIGGGRLLWTLTETPTPGDQHAPAN